MLFNNSITSKSRILRILQRLAIELIDPFFFNRHPNKYIIRLTEALSFLILYFQPNDRWNLHIFVREWSKIFVNHENTTKKNIFIFSCYRGQFSRDILLSIILARQGHKITLGYLPKLRSPIKQPLKDSNGAKEYLSYVMKILEQKSYGRIKCFDLTKYYQEIDLNEDDFRNQAHSDTVMMLQKENIDLNKNDDSQAFQFCLERLKFVYNSINNYFNIYKFDLCLIANGAAFETSQILKVAKKFKIPFNTFEKFAFKNAVILEHENRFVDFLDLDILLKLLKESKNVDHLMKHKIQEKSKQLLLERKNSTGTHWGLQYQKKSVTNTSTKDWMSKNLNDKKYVLICPNVPFDAGYDSLNTIFPTMKEWLIETVKFILNNSDLIVVVRSHPAENREGFGNEKTDLIMENANIKSENLIVIPATSFLNTYELMEKCFFGSVYSSTTGVELGMLGKLVITGANIYHARVGVSKGANSLIEYFKIIKSLINGSIKQSPEGIYKANLVYFLFHFVLQNPFPYDKPSQMVAKPINKFFYEPEFSKYDLTFELLTMNKKEFTDFFEKNMSKLIEIWN